MSEPRSDEPTPRAARSFCSAAPWDGFRRSGADAEGSPRYLRMLTCMLCTSTVAGSFAIALFVLAAPCAAEQAGIGKAEAGAGNETGTIAPDGSANEGEGAARAGTAPKQALTAAEERQLQIQILRSSDWNLRDLSRREIMQDLLGRDRVRRLEFARFRFQLSDADPLFEDDLRRATSLHDEMEDAVLSAYTKLARETLEDALGIDELEDWLEAKWDRKTRSLGYGAVDEKVGAGDATDAGRRSFRVRLSPRLSEDYLGLKMRLPYTGQRFFDSLSFRVRYDFDTDGPVYQLKFDDDSRFVHFSYEPDTEDYGDELKLSFRLFW